MITTTYKRLLLLAALPALMLASCSREEMDGGQGDSPDTQSGAIRFEIGFAPQGDPAVILSDSEGSQPKGEAPATRVATDTQFNSTWENGDEIGIYAVKHGEQLAASGNSIHNVKLTYNGSTWTAAEKLYWPADGTKLDFYAYHPYDPAANNPTSIAFNVHTDQSATTGEKSNYNHSDLLMAKTTKADGYGKGETVPLSFTHALAMVQVNVSKSMIGNYPADILKVELNGCSTDCKLNLFTQSATLPANPAPPVKIKMYPCPNDGGAPGIYAYRALVPVQEIAQGTALFRFEYDGNILLRSKPLKQPLSLVQGRAEKFDMTFPFTPATVSADVRLAELFKDEELAAITRLKVMGEMTQADFYTIRDMMPAITSLDLGGATVVGDVKLDLFGSPVQGNAIPLNALSGKESLKEFIFPRNITAIGERAFIGCSGLTGTLTIPAGVITIYRNAFDTCTGFTALSLPASLTTIGPAAFSQCTGLTGSLTIPESVTTIGDSAFRTCTGYNGTLTIPGSLRTIEMNVFAESNFSTVYISSGVSNIKSNAFDGCSNLTTLTIPASVTKMEDWAFWNCTSLSSVTCHITDVGSGSFADNIFEGVPPGNVTVYVPATAVQAYKVHGVWSSFTIQSIPAP